MPCCSLGGCISGNDNQRRNQINPEPSKGHGFIYIYIYIDMYIYRYVYSLGPTPGSLQEGLPHLGCAQGKMQRASHWSGETSWVSGARYGRFMV